nr:IS256 family transposase [uncultured Carboxylicivirga sp.]
MKKEFDYESFKAEALEGLKSGKGLSGSDNVLAPLLKDLLEGALEGELDCHLSDRTVPNRRNGKTSKIVKTDHGSIILETPRDRNGDFAPEIVKKRQTTIGEAFENRILSLYGEGLSYADIQDHLLDLYGLDASVGKLSSITDKIIPKIQEWQGRRLESVYAIVWLDAMHFKVKENGQVVSKAVYIILGHKMNGKKDLLGMYISESEGAKFWLQVLSDLQNRGVDDILIACMDNLKGFTEAVEAVFPKVDIQLCIIHQLRNSFKYVAFKDRKELGNNLKAIYQASNASEAELALDQLEDKWNHKYPLVIKSWKKNWHYLTRFFEYSKHLRRIMYTTNTIEGFNRQIRRVTKRKGAFQSEMALFKILYLAQEEVTRSWQASPAYWGQVKQELIIKFEDRCGQFQ